MDLSALVVVETEEVGLPEDPVHQLAVVPVDTAHQTGPLQDVHLLEEVERERTG